MWKLLDILPQKNSTCNIDYLKLETFKVTLRIAKKYCHTLIIIKACRSLKKSWVRIFGNKFQKYVESRKKNCSLTSDNRLCHLPSFKWRSTVSRHPVYSSIILRDLNLRNNPHFIWPWPSKGSMRVFKCLRWRLRSIPEFKISFLRVPDWDNKA